MQHHRLRASWLPLPAIVLAIGVLLLLTTGATSAQVTKALPPSRRCFLPIRSRPFSIRIAPRRHPRTRSSSSAAAFSGSGPTSRNRWRRCRCSTARLADRGRGRSCTTWTNRPALQTAHHRVLHGHNDVTAGEPASAITERSKAFVARAHDALPATRIYYVGINKSPDKRARGASSTRSTPT